jgi:membrane protease YdiL (CAAX protease family)
LKIIVVETPERLLSSRGRGRGIRWMKKFITSLPPWAEIAFVSVFAFGLFVYSSLSYALQPHAHPHYTSATFLNLTVIGLGLIAVLAVFLWLRGWTFRRLGLVPQINDIGVAVLLFVAVYAAWVVVFYLTVAISPQTAYGMQGTANGLVGRGIPLWLIVSNALVNPVFEEVFETGYIVAALKRDDNVWLAINVSVAIRLVCHLYQGSLGVLSIIPTGLIFALWFARTGRLWPVILAHAAMDLLAVLHYSRG